MVHVIARKQRDKNGMIVDFEEKAREKMFCFSYW
jgi:hypothetical protein